jgi:serine/threonine protein kinase
MRLSRAETFQSDRDSHTSQYQVNLWEHDIKIGKRLGRGSFAQVFQGLWNDSAVAIKVIEYKEGSRDAVDPCMEASLTKCASPGKKRYILYIFYV